MEKYVCIISLQPSETCSTCCDSMTGCSKFRETTNGKERGTTGTALGHVLTVQPLNLALSTDPSIILKPRSLDNRIEQVQLNPLQTSNNSLTCFPHCIYHTHRLNLRCKKTYINATAQEYMLLGHRHYYFS